MDRAVTSGVVGIPIRNLWLLLLYASDLYRVLGTQRIELEENPDDIPDLVAELLCHQVELRLKRNLSYGYRRRAQALSRVRGRIDMLTTLSQRLLDKGQIQCRFDELSVDTARNRFVRKALKQASSLVKTSSLRHRCCSLDHSLARMGVGDSVPVHYGRASERFGRHDYEDQKMVDAADLLFKLALPTQEQGSHQLVSPDDQITWIRKLFERAIAGFYQVVLSKDCFVVSAGKALSWPISAKTNGIDAILPRMKTDIVIDQREQAHRLIIDTKFNAITTKGWYRDETLRTGYLYQMYAYIHSQLPVNAEASAPVSGMLLHPVIKEGMTECVVIQNHFIWFCTVDLSGEAIIIRQRLLDLVDMVFKNELPLVQ